MALVYRNGRPYLYRSVWRDGRTTSEYVASGPTALFLAAWDAEKRQERDDERAADLAERHAIDESEQPLRAYFADVENLARCALIAAGYHQHKRVWRKRRVQRD